MGKDDSQNDGQGSEQDDRGDRLDRVEDKLDALISTVAGLVPGSHADAQRREATKLDRPTEVAELVQAELARKDKERADAETAESERSERTRDRERLTRLEERPPAPPLGRATRFMWGSE
jgi:hypothetical protein